MILFDARALLTELTAEAGPGPSGYDPDRDDPPGPAVAGMADPTADIRTPDDLPYPWSDWFQELAAIREFDGGQVREHAEAEAFGETLAAMRAAGLTTRV